MVNTISVDGKKLFVCEECLFRYRDEDWAKKCELWCKRHKSCNIGITKHAITNEDDKNGNES